MSLNKQLFSVKISRINNIVIKERNNLVDKKKYIKDFRNLWIVLAHYKNGNFRRKEWWIFLMPWDGKI